jgi:hypothetical protein
MSSKEIQAMADQYVVEEEVVIVGDGANSEKITIPSRNSVYPNNPLVGLNDIDPGDDYDPTIAYPNNGIDGNNAHDPSKGAGLGAIGGAVVGGLAGGPVGAVIGAAAGAVVSGAAVAGVDEIDNDNSPGEHKTPLPGETPGEYTDRMIDDTDRT